MAGGWTIHMAFALEQVGRSGELVALGEPPASRFLEAALAVDEGRFEDAAETLRAIGAPELEAEARVLAARTCRDAGDDTRAESHLARARELLASLGATARLRELTAGGATSRSAGS
jgi:hypothetical protein